MKKSDLFSCVIFQTLLCCSVVKNILKLSVEWYLLKVVFLVINCTVRKVWRINLILNELKIRNSLVTRKSHLLKLFRKHLQDRIAIIEGYIWWIIYVMIYMWDKIGLRTVMVMLKCSFLEHSEVRFWRCDVVLLIAMPHLVDGTAKLRIITFSIL